jgi:hypothetical protein
LASQSPDRGQPRSCTKDLSMYTLHHPFDALIDEGLLRLLLEFRAIFHCINHDNRTGCFLPNCTGTEPAAARILSSMILNSRVLLAVGPYTFPGTVEHKTAPLAAAWLVKQLPIRGALQHARWSGEAAWLPLGSAPQLVPENATAYPRPGQILLYAGTASEPELLIPYGACAFASKAGTLAGSPVITLDGSLEDLAALGSLLIAKGMQTLALNASTEEST